MNLRYHLMALISVYFQMLILCSIILIDYFDLKNMEKLINSMIILIIILKFFTDIYVYSIFFIALTSYLRSNNLEKDIKHKKKRAFYTFIIALINLINSLLVLAYRASFFWPNTPE